MKNLITAFIICLGTTVPLLAQEVFIGAKGGLNIANISNDPDNHAKLGLHLGAYGGYKFNEKMAGSLEVLYSQKGTHHTGPPIYPNGDIMVNIDYLDIPFLFHYFLTPSLNAHIGLQICSPVRAVRVFRNPPVPAEDFLKDIYSSVISFPLGITYEIAGKLNLGTRVDLALSPVGGDQRKNIVLMFSLGYTFFRKGTTLSVGKSKGGNNGENNKEEKSK